MNIQKQNKIACQSYYHSTITITKTRIISKCQWTRNLVFYVFVHVLNVWSIEIWYLVDFLVVLAIDIRMTLEWKLHVIVLIDDLVDLKPFLMIQKKVLITEMIHELFDFISLIIALVQRLVNKITVYACQWKIKFQCI